MKAKLIVILLGVLIILTSLAIAYREEIKEFSENTMDDYIIEQIQTMPEEQQKEFEEFRELKIEDKLLKSWNINKKQGTPQ